MDLIVASNNKNKIAEIKEILSTHFDNILSQGEAGICIEVEEDGKTFLENAQKKARAIFELTGKPAIADDSGLCVEALDGAPGVFSARYAGEICSDTANNQKLLSALTGVKDRRAKYVCAVCLISVKGEFTGYGEVYGEILHEARGNGGFGYDPIVLIHALNKTFAECESREKNKISHRHNALMNLMEKL